MADAGNLACCRLQESGASQQRSARLPRSAAFVVAACSLILVFAAAGAPIPLFNIYRAQDGITNVDLAVASVGYFAAAAVALLAFGRLSNHIGRRPIALFALLSAGFACLVLAGGSGAMTLTFARVLQGLACGLASSGIGAYVVDSAPRGRPWLAATIAGGAPMIGVPLGAMVSGALVEYAPSPRALVYLLLFIFLAACAALTAFSPETMARRQGAWKSLLPRLQVPSGSGRLVLAAGASFVATWSLGGFFQAFGPSVTAQYLGTADALTAAAVFSSVMVLNPVGGLASGRLDPQFALRLGMAMFVLAVVGIVASLHSQSLGPFILSSLLIGLAQGVACTGALKALLAKASAQQRAGLLATIYLIAYCGVALPGLVAGRLAQSLELLQLGEGYAALGLVASVIAVVAMRTDTRSEMPAVQSCGMTVAGAQGGRS